MANTINGAYHCHGCMWSAFDLDSGAEAAEAEAKNHASEYCSVYRCDTRHAA